MAKHTSSSVNLPISAAFCIVSFHVRVRALPCFSGPLFCLAVLWSSVAMLHWQHAAYVGMLYIRERRASCTGSIQVSSLCFAVISKLCVLSDGSDDGQLCRTTQVRGQLEEVSEVCVTWLHRVCHVSGDMQDARQCGGVD